MKKKVKSKTGKNVKGRRVGFWGFSFFAMFQVFALVLFSAATHGAVRTFTVNSFLDETDTAPGDAVCVSASGYCTLRAAIQEANALPGPDVIKLNRDLYMLTIGGISENNCATGDLDITDDLTIIGKGAKSTFINAGNLDRVFHIIGPISVTIMNVTIQNGFATDDGYGNLSNVKGGAILNESDSLSTLKGVTISNNTAAGGTNGSGGGIYNLGALEITKSNLFNNAASGASNSNVGGAIDNYGTLSIKGSIISNNIVSWTPTGLGGAIYNHTGILEIDLSTISNNIISAEGPYSQGAAIANNGTLTITGCTISNNTATGSGEGDGGGILSATFHGEKVTIIRSKIFNNVARGNLALGGGICSFNGDVILTGATLSSNAASGVSEGRGGGIYLKSGTLTLQTASKIVQNFSSDLGGGIFFGVAGTGSISPDSKVDDNIPDDIYP